MAGLLRQRGTDINLRSGPQQAEYDAIVDRLAADRPGRILDWGCGWGQVSHLMRSRGLDVTSFDFRPEVEEDGVRPLARYPEIEAYIATQDPVKLPYEDGAFDAVLSCGVLEHVADPEASLDEIRRVLRPGGRFYVFKLPNRLSYLEAIAKRIGLYYHGADTYDRVYTSGSAKAMLERHGYAVVELRHANMLPLTIPIGGVAAKLVWHANRLLARVPGLNRLATNVELVADARSGGDGAAALALGEKPEHYYDQAREDLVAALRRPVGRVLDVGCGEGGAAGGLRAAGATAITGIELMPDRAARAAERYDRVETGDALAVLDRVEGPFDTILCYDVLEHLVDPAALLRALRERAAPGAQLHVSTPNARHLSLARDLLLRGTFAYAEYGHRDATHLRWFTRRDLDAMLRAAGWAPRDWSSSAIQRLRIARLPRPERWFPRLGSELGAYQWFVIADAA